MTNVQMHANGTVLFAEKAWEELTSEEQAMVHVGVDEEITDYITFGVQRNKKNEIVRVANGKFSEAKRAEIKARSEKFDVLDAVQVLFGKGEGKKRALHKMNNQ